MKLEKKVEEDRTRESLRALRDEAKRHFAARTTIRNMAVVSEANRGLGELESSGG